MLLKCIRKAIIKRLIREALEELPELKTQGINYLNSHKEEFLEFVFIKIKCAIKDFVVKKINQAKEKIIKISDNNN